MKKHTYNDTSVETLTKELAKLKAEVASASFAKKFGKGGELKTYRENKRNIARILTALNKK